MTKDRLFLIHLVLLSALVMLAGTDNIYGGVLNPDFEHSEPGTDFNTPADWTVENYAAVLEEFIPSPQYGQQLDWDMNPVYSDHGQFFVVLSTGDTGSSDSVDHASIEQPITILEGQTLSFSYFFGTCDYIPYNDYAQVTLIPDGNSPPPREIILLNIEVEDVGSYKSMQGWEKFSYTFDANEAGSYTLHCAVYDKQDVIYKTYLALDNFRVGYMPQKGDLNGDWCVDFIDWAILSSYWLQMPARPEHAEYSDLDGNGQIDPNDVGIMGINWMQGCGY
jgi:hypothetical protein